VYTAPLCDRRTNLTCLYIYHAVHTHTYVLGHYTLHTATGCGLYNRGSVPGAVRNVPSPPRHSGSGSGARRVTAVLEPTYIPIQCPPWRVFPEIKRPESGVGLSPPSAEIKNVWSYIFAFPYVCIGRCLIKQFTRSFYTHTCHIFGFRSVLRFIVTA
jgi:hypothetical protein